ncbi:unnamed protein product [Adineta steineri]|uniref:Uncharacterized protein n=1 Tax=Adineta steineri TaxID=433720 RepID=A0A814JG57_9BILA|nr:unnamed protein product [Adineta steineri]
MSATGTVTGKNGCEAATFNGNEILTVSVQDTARMGAPAITLGQQEITLKKGDKFPINYNVQYNEEDAIAGSEFNILAGGSFISAVATFLQLYDPLSGVLIGTAFALISGQTGPFIIVISSTGITVTSGTGVSSTVPVPTVAMG